MANANLTAERLRELLNYDPETGVFTWRVRPVNSVHVGDIAGNDDGNGYLRMKISYASHSMHRLAWLYAYGVWPDGEIDHINGIRSDNRLVNLRVVSRTGNVQNRHKTWGKSGFMGVYANFGKWRAAIQVNGKLISLGNFDTPEEASAAYLAAKRIHHPTSVVAHATYSNCACVTDPLTVSVKVPAVGVNVSDTRLATPVPTSGPAVDVPDSVTVPVP